MMVKKNQNWLERLRPPSPRTLVAIGGIVITAMVLIWIVSYRHRRREALFSEAAGSSFRGSEYSSNAIRELASHKDDQSTGLLLDIAEGNTQVQLDAIRIEAINALRGRDGDKVAIGLASLFQPHNGLDVRTAAAESLQSRYCNQECILLILHYLERIFRGEQNAEDRWARSLDPDLPDKQKKLYEMLSSILRQQSQETVLVLRNTYGLGTAAPSTFALNLSTRIGLADACPLLLQSFQRLRKLDPELFRAPRDELEQAITSLSCNRVR